MNCTPSAAYFRPHWGWGGGGTGKKTLGTPGGGGWMV